MGILIQYHWHIGLVVVIFVMWLFRKKKMPKSAVSGKIKYTDFRH